MNKRLIFLVTLILCFVSISFSFADSESYQGSIFEIQNDNLLMQDQCDESMTTELNGITSRIMEDEELSEIEYSSHDNCTDVYLYSNSIKGKMTGVVKVNRKKELNVSIYLQRKYSGGEWNTKAKLENRKLGGLIFNTLSVSCKSKTTSFWRVKVITSGSLPSEDAIISTKAALVNKKCEAYPIAFEPYSKKKVKVPSTTWKIDQNERDVQFRKKYISSFKKKYPNAKINWKEYEIHHMRPLKYGGTNALSNGIALKKNVHAKFNAWWSNY